MTINTSLGSDVAGLYGLIREVRRLFHRLANGTDRLHADLEVSVAQRAVLEDLADSGASTVPALARRKGVSRQHVQVLANRLLAAGLVEARDNDAHRRSPVLDLTESGRRVFATMRRREDRLLQAVARSLGPRPLAAMTATLRAVGDAVEAESDDRPAGARRRTTPAASRRPTPAPSRDGETP